MSRVDRFWDRFWPGTASTFVDAATLGAIVGFVIYSTPQLCKEPPSAWIVIVFCLLFPTVIPFWNSVKREIFQYLFPSKKRTAEYVNLWKVYDFPEPELDDAEVDGFVRYLSSTALDRTLPFDTRHEALMQYSEVAPGASFLGRSFVERQKMAGVDAMLDYLKFLGDAPPKKKTRRNS